jgi:L-ribulose-5-phosphate 3-epimerase
VKTQSHPDIKIGVTQYAACPPETDEHELLTTVAELGLDGIEPYLDSAKDHWLQRPSDKVKEFAQLAGQMGLSVPSVAVGIFNNNPALIEREGADSAVDIIHRTLEFTAAIGARIMLLCTFIQSHPDSEDKKANLLEVIRRIEPKARELGIVIALESPLSATELAALVDEAYSDCVGVYYDLGNAIALGFDPVQEIKILNHRIRAVHIKDSINKLGGLHLGQGSLDLNSGIEALKGVGYQGWLILETPCQSRTALEQDIKTLKDYF